MHTLFVNRIRLIQQAFTIPGAKQRVSPLPPRQSPARVLPGWGYKLAPEATLQDSKSQMSQNTKKKKKINSIF